MPKANELEASLIYPREVHLKNGQNVSLRLMEAGDWQSVLSFARSLPPDDLLFLRTDITEPKTIDVWIQNIEEGTTITVLAELNREVAGYASLHTDGARWTRRIGEVRVQVGVGSRGLGLGKRLVGEIFRLGQDLGLKKMAATMTPEQASARTAFDGLGFRVEATLGEWVVDREGKSHDLLVMTLDCER
jgi:L-amino acid N-acyltransferase YncA